MRLILTKCGFRCLDDFNLSFSEPFLSMHWYTCARTKGKSECKIITGERLKARQTPLQLSTISPRNEHEQRPNRRPVQNSRRQCADSSADAAGEILKAPSFQRMTTSVISRTEGLDCWIAYRRGVWSQTGWKRPPNPVFSTCMA